MPRLQKRSTCPKQLYKIYIYIEKPRILIILVLEPLGPYSCSFYAGAPVDARHFMRFPKQGGWSRCLACRDRLDSKLTVELVTAKLCETFLILQQLRLTIRFAGTYVCILMHKRMQCVYIYTYIPIYIYIHTHTYTHAYTRTCTYTYTHTNTRTYTCTCTCVYIYIYMYAPTYTYMCTSTSTCVPT